MYVSSRSAGRGIIVEQKKSENTGFCACVHACGSTYVRMFDMPPSEHSPLHSVQHMMCV